MRDVSNWEFEDQLPRAGEVFPGSELRRLHVPGSSLPPGSRIERIHSSLPASRGGGVVISGSPRLGGPSRELTEQLDRFCWGAFLWGGFWALCHRVWLGLFAWVPVLGLPVAYWLGRNGHRLAWDRGGYRSLSRFQRHQRIWVVSFFVAVPIVIPFGIFATSLGREATARYLQKERTTQAQSMLTILGAGLVSCAAQSKNGLPASTGWVPSQLSQVAGAGYRVPATEWKGHQAFGCAGLARDVSVHFQYRWQRDSSKIGKVVARADHDGDGAVDQQLSVVVTCNASDCNASKPISEAVEAALVRTEGIASSASPTTPR